MTNTGLLHFIREELMAQEISWKSERELFEMLVPHEDWKKYKTNWSNWKRNEDGRFRVDYLRRTPNILLAIQTRLSFDSSVWEANNATQREAVRRGVTLAFKTKRDPIDIGAFIPKYSLDEKQKVLLEHWKNASIFQIEEELEQYKSYFQRTLVNQPFLLELLNLLYLKGAYQLLVDKVFPKLLSTKRSHTKVKLLEANVLSSLPSPKYLQTVELLNSIEGKDSVEMIDLKTAAVSNLRRHHMTHGNLDKEEFRVGVSTIMQTYYDLYTYDEVYHYYPALHFLYALVLSEALKLESLSVDKQQFYKSLQASIEKDKKSKERDSYYYATMSYFELRLLLGKDVVRELGAFLELYEPSLTLLHRTKRQMLEYVELIERYEIELPRIDSLFKRVIGLFEDYEKMLQEK